MRNRKLMASLLTAALGAGVSSTASAAVIITQWTFETSLPAGAPGAGAANGPYAAEVGTGSATGLHSAASTYSNPAGNGSAHSFSANVWSVGDYYQFAASTAGNTGIDVEWDETSSGTGPGTFQLQYSTDGTTFTPFGSAYAVQINGAPNTAWSPGAGVQALYHYAVDLSSITGLNNDASAAFRLVDTSTTSASGGTVATGGTDRVDNFTVESGPVPEPASLGFLGVAGLWGAKRRRR